MQGKRRQHPRFAALLGPCRRTDQSARGVGANVNHVRIMVVASLSLSTSAVALYAVRVELLKVHCQASSVLASGTGNVPEPVDGTPAAKPVSDTEAISEKIVLSVAKPKLWRGGATGRYPGPSAKYPTTYRRSGRAGGYNECILAPVL